MWVCQNLWLSMLVRWTPIYHLFWCEQKATRFWPKAICQDHLLAGWTPIWRCKITLESSGQPDFDEYPPVSSNMVCWKMDHWYPFRKVIFLARNLHFPASDRSHSKSNEKPSFSYGFPMLFLRFSHFSYGFPKFFPEFSLVIPAAQSLGPQGKILLDDLEGGLETAMQAPTTDRDLPRKMGFHHLK